MNYIHKDLAWQLLAAKGTAGGILVGVNKRKFEPIAWKVGSFCIAGMLRNSLDNLVWRLIVVYGSPYEEGKAEFLIELDDILANWDGPTVIGGILILPLLPKKKVMVLSTKNGLTICRI